MSAGVAVDQGWHAREARSPFSAHGSMIAALLLNRHSDLS